MGEKATLKAAEIATNIRGAGMHAQFDVVGRSVKAQMKFANKIGAAYTIVLGDSELESGAVTLKNMTTGEETPLSLETFDEDFANIAITQALAASFGDFADVDVEA